MKRIALVVLQILVRVEAWVSHVPSVKMIGSLSLENVMNVVGLTPC